MMPSEETSKMAIQLIERLGFPIALTCVFAWVLYARTSSFLIMQKEYMDKERETCEAQLEVMKEIRDLMKLARLPAGGQ